MICDSCGKEFEAGSRTDGIPNGLGFLLENGKQITVCAECVIAVGRMDPGQKNAFFRKLQEKRHDGGSEE